MGFSWDVVARWRACGGISDNSGVILDKLAALLDNSGVISDKLATLSDKPGAISDKPAYIGQSHLDIGQSHTTKKAKTRKTRAFAHKNTNYFGYV